MRTSPALTAVKPGPAIGRDDHLGAGIKIHRQCPRFPNPRGPICDVCKRPRSKKRAPTIVNLTVKRRYLTEREVERLMDCARKHGRYGHRDATMILLAYPHGL